MANNTFNAADNPIFTGNAASVPNRHLAIRLAAPNDQVDPPFTKLKYGDFSFPAASTVEYEDVPVMDASGRNVFCRKLIVTVRFLIYHSYPLDSGVGGPYATAQVPGLNYQTLSTDLPVEVLRSILLRPRQEFWLEGLGYGRIHVYDRKRSNTVTKGPTSVPDIQNGPQPNEKSFTLQNLGALAKMATWQIVCHVPPTFAPFAAPGDLIVSPPTDAQLAKGRTGSTYPDSLSYKTSLTLLDGYSTRTITGIVKNYLEAPTSTGIEGEAINRPLNWRTQLDRIFRPLLGFRREFPLFEESEDRTELRFVIIDHEINSDNPYEVGVTRINAPYLIRGNTPMIQWNVSLDVTIEVAPNYPKIWGYVIFVRIYSDLIRRIQQNYYKSRPSRDLNASQANQATGTQIQDAGFNTKEAKYLSAEEITKISKRPWAQLLSLQFQEDRYTREISCSAHWTMVDVELEDILIASGFAQPGNTGATWDSWRRSVDRVLTAEGYQNLSAPVEYSIDLSQPNTDVALGNTLPATNIPYNTVTLTNGKDIKTQARGGKEAPPDEVEDPTRPPLKPGEGYLKFENRLRIVSQGKVIFHSIVDASQPNAPQEVGNDEGQWDDAPAPFSGPPTTYSPIAGLSVNMMPPRKYAIMYGYSMRHTKPPRIPVLRKVGIANAIETKDSRQETSIIVATDLDGKVQKIYTVWWIKKYDLDREPLGNTVVSDFTIE